MTPAAGKRVAVSCDHAGVETKQALIAHLRDEGFEAVDMGPSDTTPVDYPGPARDLASAVVDGRVDWGVLICGTGIGMSIAANKVAGARAALVHDAFTATMAREHNDANIVVVGARVLDLETMKALVSRFGVTPFTPGDDGRHARRVADLEPR